MTDLNTIWNQLLWKCYHHGQKTTKDDSPIQELMGNYIYIERPQDLPFNIKIDNPQKFLENLNKGIYDLPNYPIKGEALANYVNSWNDPNQIYIDKETRQKLELTSKPFIYTYPERILHNKNITKNNNKPQFINQLDTIKKRLTKNQGSNRAVATLYHPGIDKEETDIPCLNWIQATIRKNKLELHCIFRSNDLYGAWPSNMYLLTYLGLSLAEQFKENKIHFNGIHYHSSSLHIYKTDIPAVEKILNGE